MTNLPSEIVCTLTEPELRDRKDMLRRSLKPYLAKATYAAGTSLLVFSKPKVTRNMLDNLIELERACCPFFSFDLSETNSAFELTLTGPTGSEAMIRDFFGTTSDAGCGCSGQTTSTRSRTPKYFASLVGLCVIACATPPVLAALGLVSLATGAWLARGIEGAVIGLGLFGFAYLFVQYGRMKRRRV